MSEIAEEILKEFPELEKGSGKIEEVLNYLVENKPTVEISSKFKKELKKRLDDIIAMKIGKKFGFLYFLVPTLSFCVFLFGMAVIYSDINILSKRVFEEKIMMSDLTVPFSEVGTDIIEQNNINLNNDGGSHNFLSGTTTNANLIGVIDYSDNNDDVDSFDDFCTKEFGVLNVTSNGKGCVIDGVECLETDYYSIEGCDLILH